jgi:uncharacterized protein
MVLTYRRPGVYLSESLLVNPGNVASAATVACFVGVAEKGPLNEPTLVESWSDYVGRFGSFAPIPDPAKPGTKVLTYLPFSVYAFFQNGGRQAWIIRSASPTQDGEASSIDVTGPNPAPASATAFTLSATSTGVWGDTIKYNLVKQDDVTVDTVVHRVFTLQILVINSEGIDEVVETFSALSVSGDIAGTRRVDSVINDSSSGSMYVRVSGVNEDQPKPDETEEGAVSLADGVDPNIPDEAALTGSAELVEKVDGPVTLNIVGYLADSSTENTSDAVTSWVSGAITPSVFPDRSDIFVVNDSAPPRAPGATSAAYKSTILTNLGKYPGDPYVASYGPWVKVPHPQRVGTVIDVPPGGAVVGMMARIDATIGMFRAPAGVIAGLSNAVGVQTKFTDTELGDLNAQNINMIRSVVGAGIAVMGARTRKSYGADRYVSARRTLIYISEVLRRSTQFAVFENNDQRLWSALRMSADRILRPLWEAGGLKGANASEAYFIRCDDTNNTPSVIQSGEVRMEVGVALQYPAEFVIIRITQFDRGTYTAEVQPNA